MKRLSSGDVQVWLFDPRELSNPTLRDRAFRLLAADERARAERFVFPEDRHAFVAARGLARAVLASHTGVAADRIAFAVSEYGKLRLAQPEAEGAVLFNLSHTRDVVAVAVTRQGEIGVDVELVRHPPLELVDRYFAPPEAERLRALDRESQREAFFAVWTLKESFIKALGLGLSMPLDRFAVQWSPPQLLPFGDFVETASNWHFTLQSPTESCRLAVCVQRRHDTPRVETRWAQPW